MPEASGAGTLLGGRGRGLGRRCGRLGHGRRLDRGRGIGGGRSLGFGAKRVRSLPDGVAQVLTEYLQQRTERLTTPAASPEASAPALTPGDDHKEHAPQPATPEPPAKDQPLLKIGDLCPECGQAALINEEGCRKCYACGYSEC